MVKVASLVIFMHAIGLSNAAQAEENPHARSVKITFQNETKAAYQIKFSGKNNCVLDPGRKNTFIVQPRIDSSTTIQVDEGCHDEAEIAWSLVTNNDSGERTTASVTYAELKVGAGWHVLVSAFAPHNNISFEALCSSYKIKCFKSPATVNNINSETDVVINLTPTGLESR